MRDWRDWISQEKTGPEGVVTSYSAVLLNNLGKFSMSWTESGLLTLGTILRNIPLRGKASAF